MSDYPLVSVLMPLYNKEAYVTETILSVLNQTYPNIELIIVDDGSTDNSFDIAQRFESNNVRVMRQKNKGASAARNMAFDHCKGEFIQYLDADDLLHPQKIFEQVKLIRDCPLTIATAHWQYFEETIDEKRADEHVSLLRDFDDLTDFSLTIIYRGLPIHVWLIPRLAIIKAGRWDEEIFIFDDKDFLMRLMPAVRAVRFSDSAFCYYRMPKSKKNLSTRRDKQVLLGAMKYIDNAETYFLSVQNTEFHFALACLYKKILLVAIHDKEIIRNIKQRVLKIGLLPDCNRSLTVRFSKFFFGMHMTFWLIYARAKYK